MPISQRLAETLTRSSWIRRMFEEGNRLRRIHGDENVHDFSLGNPDLPPPEPLLDRLRALTAEAPDGLHRYMPNAGWPDVRAKIAAHLAGRTGLPYRAEHVLMTVGAGGALNVLLKAILDPGDEVVVLCPYFAEYEFYVANHGGRHVTADTREDFSLDAGAVARALGPRTRAVIVNSPNNPTGAVYSREDLQGLAAVLEEGSRRTRGPIYLITDEPYRKIVYDGVECPEIPPLYPHTILITSHSKDLGLAGERIGYLGIAPSAADAESLLGACTFANRTLGFVNAPSLFQRAVADCQDVTVDVGVYLERRNLLLREMREMGFQVVVPGGAFYLFPKSPIPDETEFVARLMKERILVVPGRGFGRAGYFRVSYAVPTQVIERSLPGWRAVARSFPQLAAR